MRSLRFAVITLITITFAIFANAQTEESMPMEASYGSSSSLIKFFTGTESLKCRMKGVWVETNEIWEFDSDYLAKNGPDYFNGKYVNPGKAEASIIGRANDGTWDIVLTYTDAGHKNMVKKLKGKGFRDRVNNTVTVEGDYKTFVGTTDTNANGKFKLEGKCKKV